jgi:hypothetical protein
LIGRVRLTTNVTNVRNKPKIHYVI